MLFCIDSVICMAAYAMCMFYTLLWAKDARSKKDYVSQTARLWGEHHILYDYRSNM